MILPAWLRRVPHAVELLTLVAAVVAVQAAPRSVPLGAYALGISFGAGLAAHAVAVLLVYRSNRFLNLAQIQIGASAGTLFLLLVQGRRLIDVTRSLCGGCIAAEPGPLARHLNFTMSVILAIAAAVLASYLLSLLVTRRFRAAPRIVCSLVTVFAAQVLVGLVAKAANLLLPQAVGAQDAGQVFQAVQRRSTLPPGDFRWNIDPLASYHLADLLLIAVAVSCVLAVSYWLHRTRAGAELRAASERIERAETLGVDVTAAFDRTWLVAGLIAGCVGVVSQFGAGLSADDALPAPSVLPMVLILVALLVGRMDTLWVVGVAGVLVGILHRTWEHAYQSTEPLTVTLLVLVSILMLLQRDPGSRADQQAEAAIAVTTEARPTPPELASLSQVRRWRRGAAAVGAAVALGLPWITSAATVATASRFVILMLVGLSLSVLTGWAGQLSLGQMGTAAGGAWVAAVTGMPAPLAVVAGGLAGMALAVLIGLPSLRLGELNFAVMTLAFGLAAPAIFGGSRYLGKLLPQQLERPSLLGMELQDPRIFYYAMTLVVAGACLAVVGLRRSSTGRMLIAARSNPTGLAAMGISPSRAKLTGFAIAGALTGTAGALLVYHDGRFVTSNFDAGASIVVFLYAVLGGLGAVLGPILGFTFLAAVALSTTNPLFVLAGSGTGGILLLAAAPGGFAQLVYGLRDAALRRLALRLRINVPALIGRRTAGLHRVPLQDARRVDALALAYDLPRQWSAERPPTVTK